LRRARNKNERHTLAFENLCNLERLTVCHIAGKPRTARRGEGKRAEAQWSMEHPAICCPLRQFRRVSSPHQTPLGRPQTARDNPPRTAATSKRLPLFLSFTPGLAIQRGGHFSLRSTWRAKGNRTQAPCPRAVTRLSCHGGVTGVFLPEGSHALSHPRRIQESQHASTIAS